MEVARSARVAFDVNGERVTVESDPTTSLLDVLRNHLRLTGTMFGCGAGACGACFVLLDGQATASCETPLWALDGKSVRTVEGLAAGDELSPLQQAMLDMQAAQCGYCLSGVLIAGTELLACNPAPTATEVRAALDRNLCRCGSQPRMVEAVLRASAAGRPA